MDKNKRAYYPVLNMRSEIFFVMQCETKRIGCSQLLEIMDRPYYETDANDYRINTDLQVRDDIVRDVWAGLKKPTSDFTMSLDDYFKMCDLSGAYLRLLEKQYATVQEWKDIQLLLRNYGLYKTFEESMEAAIERLRRFL
jgi:hypothetical protein